MTIIAPHCPARNKPGLDESSPYVGGIHPPGCCAVGTFFDDEVEALLGVDGRQEFSLYLASVGRV